MIFKGKDNLELLKVLKVKNLTQKKFMDFLKKFNKNKQ